MQEREEFHYIEQNNGYRCGYLKCESYGGVYRIGEEKVRDSVWNIADGACLWRNVVEQISVGYSSKSSANAAYNYRVPVQEMS